MEKQAIKNIPESPGVYIFKTKNQRPIYIGKALNLKNRINSYFDLNLQTKTAKMVDEAKSLEFIIVNSELEALILEAKLIRQHQPKYNSVSKDDKHPLYITITKDEFPRVLTSRKSGDFGPFPSSNNVYQVLKMIRKVFPFSDHKKGKEKCFYNQMGLCKPCPNEIKNIEEKRMYLRNIKKIKSLLNGNINHIKQNLEKEMDMFSKKQEFEKASILRDQLQKLEYITQPIIPSKYYLKNPNLISDIRNLEIKNLKSILNKNFKLKKNNKFRLKNLHRIEL